MAKNHNLSIILYTVRSSPLPYEEKLRKLRGIGYHSIQGGFAEGLSNAQHVALLDSLGMEMCCFAGGLEAIAAEPGKYIEGCRAFDCDEIMIGTLPVECRASYDGYLRGAEIINKVGRELAREGVHLGYHNHAQEFRRFPQGKTGMDLLFENFDPVIHFMPDTHWLQAGGADILQWIEKLKGRMKYLHVKDYRIAPANSETGIGDTVKQFAPIGAGNLPWPEIVAAALNIGVEAFIVEQDEMYGESPFDCAAQSFETLKALGLN